MKHIVLDGVSSEKCLFCGEGATHMLSEDVWKKSRGPLVGSEFNFYLCCRHYLWLVSKTGDDDAMKRALDFHPGADVDFDDIDHSDPRLR